MVSGRWKLISLLQLLLLQLIPAESKGEMAMDTSGMVSWEEEMGKGPLPECFEEDKAYIGYAMNITENNTETGERYVSGCPNPQHCQMMCQEAEGCEWFNWSNTTGNVMSRCWMKRGKGMAMEKTGVITGPKYCKQEENRRCIERNRMYIGDGLNVWNRRDNNFGRQKTESHCQELCKRTHGCKWFNWNAKSECWLKKSHGQQKTANVRLEPGVSTGPRECTRIPAEHSCDDGWHYFEGRCFLVNIKLDNATLSYADVSELCRDQGASLVCFQSQQEFNFVTDIMDRNHWQQQGLDFWVGANRSSGQEEFRWEIDNTTNVNLKSLSECKSEIETGANFCGAWAHGEPKGHKCLQVFRDGDDNWVFKTDNCEERDQDGTYICEKPANTKSEETTEATEATAETEEPVETTTQDATEATDATSMTEEATTETE